MESLGAQLNPSHVAQRIRTGARDATIGKVQHMATQTREKVADQGRSLLETIRENPVPAAMIAGGIGWLLLGDKAKSAGGNVGSSAQDAAGDLADHAQEATEQVEEKFEQNPMALGAVALALGVAVGSAVPSTRREARLMGDARDRLVDTARDKAGEVRDRARNVAERAAPEVKSAVKDAAREEKPAPQHV
jgi:uncharacterized protein YjbJ (UPF0337 family)